MEATELPVTEAVSRLGYARQALSRLLNTAAGGLRTGAGTAWDKRKRGCGWGEPAGVKC